MWGAERALDAGHAEQGAEQTAVQRLSERGRQRQRQCDGSARAAQRHHLAQVLVLERQQRAPVDGRPQVPCHIVCLLECHLHSHSTTCCDDYLSLIPHLMPDARSLPE